jgi:hypothetical protein
VTFTARKALLAGVAAALAASLPAGCGATHARQPGIPAALLSELRPIGRGPRFQPPVRGQIRGRCEQAVGPRDGVHVEVFAANRVVIIPPGIGTEPPRHRTPTGIVTARCYGPIVTLQPTGVVLVRPKTELTVADLFSTWGQPLKTARIASFAGGRVRAYVDGRRTTRQPSEITLTRHAEIVLEIGPYVPPHRSFTFPPGI